jgi:hypothetical protein
MRGIYTAEYLNCLSEGFSKRDGRSRLDIGKAFDLIVGTSTGAIVACAPVAGVRPPSTSTDSPLIPRVHHSQAPSNRCVSSDAYAQIIVAGQEFCLSSLGGLIVAHHLWYKRVI